MPCPFGYTADDDGAEEEILDEEEDVEVEDEDGEELEHKDRPKESTRSKVREDFSELLDTWARRG